MAGIQKKDEQMKQMGINHRFVYFILQAKCLFSCQRIEECLLKKQKSKLSGIMQNKYIYLHLWSCIIYLGFDFLWSRIFSCGGMQNMNSISH